MKIKLVNKLPQPKSQYKLVVSFMHGDGDGYTESIVFIDEDNESELIKLLEALESSECDFDEIPDELKPYFNSGVNPAEIKIQWPGDVTCLGESLASYDGYVLTYFNVDGEEFSTKIVGD